jgi:hypothetical protein
MIWIIGTSCKPSAETELEDAQEADASKTQLFLLSLLCLVHVVFLLTQLPYNERLENILQAAVKLEHAGIFFVMAWFAGSQQAVGGILNTLNLLAVTLLIISSIKTQVFACRAIIVKLRKIVLKMVTYTIKFLKNPKEFCRGKKQYVHLNIWPLEDLAYIDLEPLQGMKIDTIEQLEEDFSEVVHSFEQSWIPVAKEPPAGLQNWTAWNSGLWPGTKERFFLQATRCQTWTCIKSSGGMSTLQEPLRLLVSPDRIERIEAESENKDKEEDLSNPTAQNGETKESNYLDLDNTARDGRHVEAQSSNVEPEEEVGNREERLQDFQGSIVATSVYTSDDITFQPLSHSQFGVPTPQGNGTVFNGNGHVFNGNGQAFNSDFQAFLSHFDQQACCGDVRCGVSEPPDSRTPEVQMVLDQAVSDLTAAGTISDSNALEDKDMHDFLLSGRLHRVADRFAYDSTLSSGTVRSAEIRRQRLIDLTLDYCVAKAPRLFEAWPQLKPPFTLFGSK